MHAFVHCAHETVFFTVLHECLPCLFQVMMLCISLSQSCSSASLAATLGSIVGSQTRLLQTRKELGCVDRSLFAEGVASCTLCGTYPGGWDDDDEGDLIDVDKVDNKADDGALRPSTTSVGGSSAQTPLQGDSADDSVRHEEEAVDSSGWGGVSRGGTVNGGGGGTGDRGDEFKGGGGGGGVGDGDPGDEEEDE